MADAQTQNCGGCKYFLQEHEGGLCRRFPPVVVAFPGPQGPWTTGIVFPAMLATGWCGEWKGRLIL